MIPLKPRASLFLEDDGRLAVSHWHDGVDGMSTYGLSPGDSCLGISFSTWMEYAGRGEIDLSGWRGTGSGMIGGPAKIEVEFIMSEKYEGGYYDDVDDAKLAIEELQSQLQDDRIEYSTFALKQIAGYLETARGFIREAALRPLTRDKQPEPKETPDE